MIALSRVGLTLLVRCQEKHTAPDGVDELELLLERLSKCRIDKPEDREIARSLRIKFDDDKFQNKNGVRFSGPYRIFGYLVCEILEIIDNVSYYHSACTSLSMIASAVLDFHEISPFIYHSLAAEFDKQ